MLASLETCNYLLKTTERESTQRGWFHGSHAWHPEEISAFRSAKVHIWNDCISAAKRPSVRFKQNRDYGTGIGTEKTKIYIYSKINNTATATRHSQHSSYSRAAAPAPTALRRCAVRCMNDESTPSKSAAASMCRISADAAASCRRACCRRSNRSTGALSD